MFKLVFLVKRKARPLANDGGLGVDDLTRRRNIWDKGQGIHKELISQIKRPDEVADHVFAIASILSVV